MKGKNVMSAGHAGLWTFFLFWVEVFLAIRFVLHFFAVNPTNGFASWVFNSTDTMMTPFRGVFSNAVSGHPHFVDLQTLFVMAGYAVFTAGMLGLLGWFNTAPRKK